MDRCLFNVAQTNRTEVARKLFAYGANINAKISYQSTPMMVLMESYKYGETNLDMVELFLKQNPDLSIRNSAGYSAEDYCCKPEIVRLLDAYKKSSAMNFKYDYHNDIQQVLSGQTGINTQDGQFEYTPLMKAFLMDDKETFIRLLEMGASLSLTNVDINHHRCETINQMALRHNRADYVYLINKFVFRKAMAYYDTFDESWNRDQKAQQRHKDWDLIKNCIKGNLNGVQKALQAGADINATGWEDYTPLMYAVHFGHQDIVKEILQSKSPALRFLDIFHKNVHKESVAAIAYKKNDAEMLNLINQYAKKDDPYFCPQYKLSRTNWQSHSRK